MSKKVAVLFSGGLDSTYLVWKNLKDGNTVIPIYVEIENNQVKTILEKNRIKLLWKEFDKEFNNKNDYSYPRIEPIEYAIKIAVDANEGSLYFKQVPIWIFSVVFLQGMNVDEVQIGYVCNDDAISYLEDIQNIYNAYQPISKPMKPLVFPITKMKKFEMAEELPEQYRKYIFSCENATIIGKEDNEFIEYEPCCECVPCKTIITNEYYKISGFSDIYKKAINKHYINELHYVGYKIFDKEGKDCTDWWNVAKPKREPYQLEIDFNCCDVIVCEKSLDMLKLNG
jgi:hypothetical protein